MHFCSLMRHLRMCFYCFFMQIVEIRKSREMKTVSATKWTRTLPDWDFTLNRVRRGGGIECAVLVWSWTGVKLLIGSLDEWDGHKTSHMELCSWNVFFVGVSGRGNGNLKWKDSYSGIIFSSFCSVQFFIFVDSNHVIPLSIDPGISCWWQAFKFGEFRALEFYQF